MNIYNGPVLDFDEFGSERPKFQPKMLKMLHLRAFHRIDLAWLILATTYE